MARNDSNRILVCLRYGIGDVVMELPALRGLRADRPRAHLTALGAWPALELFEDDPLFDARAGIQDFGLEHWGDHGDVGVREWLRKWCDANRFTEVLDACHTVAGVRAVLAERDLPTFDTGGALETEGTRGGSAARSIWRSAVRAWGLTDRADEPVPTLHLPERARHTAHEYFLQHGLAGREVVAVAPVASSRLKRWPLDRLCRFMSEIAAERNCRLLVFGVLHEDRETIDRVTRAVPPGTLHHVEPLHLQSTAAMIERCDALLANDTGLMHIGATVATPTVAIFGPTSANVALPVGAAAASATLPCEYRLEGRFGPPQCVLEDRCLLGVGGCISTVTAEAAIPTLANLLDGQPATTSGAAT